MTTNTNDLRAASERFRQGDSYDWIVDPDTDAYLLANAYLAEHPADDDEPWDMEWLTTISFGRTGDRGTMVIENARLRVLATDVPYWLIADIVSGGVIRIPRPTTRRDVRQLLRSLGFKTRDTT